MTTIESLAVAEKLMELLKSAAGLGITATLNLETRNGRISSTFTVEELRVPDVKPSSNKEKKKHNSSGSQRRSKDRLIRYQESKTKDMEMNKDSGLSEFVEMKKVKSNEKPS